MKKFAVSAFALAAIAGVANAGILTINEIRIDSATGTDEEYFELFGSPGSDLSNFSYIVIGDGSGVFDGVVENITSLAGQSIPADGHFLAADVTGGYGTGTLGLGGSIDFDTALNFENSDNVTHLLVSGLNPAINTGSGFGGSDLDVNDDGVIDATGDWDGDTIDDGPAWGNVIDSIALLEEIGGGDMTYSANTVGPDGSFVPAHVFRLADGTGPWNIGAFGGGNDTPGVVNPAPASAALLALSGLAIRRRR